MAQMTTQIGVGPAGEGRTFPVLWDEGNRVADLFGLKHDFSDATKDLYKAAGLDIETINGAEAGWTGLEAVCGCARPGSTLLRSFFSCCWRSGELCTRCSYFSS